MQESFIIEKNGFPTPDRVPIELEEAISLWMSPDILARQGQLLDSLNITHPNNYTQQQAYKSIMESIVNFKDVNQGDIIQHNFHIIGGPGGTRKLSLLKKLHAACCNNGILITICAATSLVALSYDGATMAHSLFLHPVEDETDVDDQNLAGCNFNQDVVTFCKKYLPYFGMNLFQKIAFSWKLSWRNSKQHGIHHVITFLCVPVILLRHVWTLPFKNPFTSI